MMRRSASENKLTPLKLTSDVLPRINPKDHIITPSSDQRKVVYKPFDQKLTFICKFCGGKSCKHENWQTYPESAIKGLNSDWVTSNILATQRPSTRIIKEYNITEAFKLNGINAIFNLQEPGEHPFCGDGIHPQSGFSYFPEEFYEHGIYFFNFGWRDMTATSTDVILKILKQMSFSLMNGSKIAIHCHAGRGRTGLIIAAWLIYHHNMSAKEAIKHVRNKRKGAIQSKSQEEILRMLEKEIRESRIIFHTSSKFSFDDYLFHQKKLLPLSTESQTRFVPNIVITTLDRMETLVSSKICTPMDIALAFSSPNDMLYYKGEWTANHEKLLKTYKERMNAGNYQISEIDDPRVLAQAVLDFFDNFTIPAIKSQFIDTIHSQIHNKSRTIRNTKDHFFKQLDKKEFMLVESFVKFFSKLLNGENESDLIHIRKAVLRICISLVLERKRLDKLFLKRSLIKDHSSDDRVTYLYIFMLKWIENFDENFTENYMIVNSPLNITNRILSERISSSPRHSTFLKAENGHIDPNNPFGKEEEPKSFSSYITTSNHNSQSIFKQQAMQEGKIQTVLKSDAERRISARPKILIHADKNSSPSSQNSDSSKPTSSPKLRVSLLGDIKNPFAQEDYIAGTLISKTYDDFFSKNALIQEENDQEGDEVVSSNHVQESQKIDDIMDEIEGLSQESQNILLQRLLRLRGPETMTKMKASHLSA